MHHRTYEIHVRGDLPPALLAELDGATARDVDGETVLLTPDIDQESLHRLVTRLRDLGIELVEMHRAAGTVPRQTPRQP